MLLFCAGIALIFGMPTYAGLLLCLAAVARLMEL